KRCEYCSTGVSALKKRTSPGEMIDRGAAISAWTCAGDTSEGIPNTSPTVIGGTRTLVASSCSDGGFGERRRATVPPGRRARREGAAADTGGEASGGGEG